MISPSIFDEPEYTMELAEKLYNHLNFHQQVNVQTVSFSDIPEPYTSLWNENILFQRENPCFKIIIKSGEKEVIFYMDAWEMTQEAMDDPKIVFQFYIETRVNIARRYAEEAFGTSYTWSSAPWSDEEVNWNQREMQEVKPLYDFLGKETWIRFFRADPTF